MIQEKIQISAVEDQNLVVTSVQGEGKSRILNFTILDSERKPLELIDKRSVLYVKKNDGHITETVGVCGENSVSFTLDSQSVATPGINEMWIEIYNDKIPSLLRIGKLLLNVIPCDLSGAEPSETVLTAAQIATARANQAANSVEAEVEKVEIVLSEISLISKDIDSALEKTLESLDKSEIAINKVNSATSLVEDGIVRLNATIVSCESVIELTDTARTSTMAATVIASEAAEYATESGNYARDMANQVLSSGNAYSENLLAHMNDFNNPHSLSAESVGALSSNIMEQGTFTPTLVSVGGTDPIYTASYANGYYVKIGKLCIFCIVMSVIISEVGSGTTAIEGLPFINGTAYSQAMNIIRVTGGSNSTPYAAYIEPSSSRIRITSHNLFTTVKLPAETTRIGYSGCFITK